MNLLNKNTWRNLALVIFGATTLAACGGAGSCATCSTPTPNANLALTFTAPAAYPAGIAADVPVMVTNTSSVAANNVVYSIDATTNTTGGNITISPASQAACANLAAQQSCQLVAQIAASPISHPGAFSVVASSSSSQSTLNKVTNFFKLNATTTNLADASVGLVAMPTNTQTGANGITLYYPTTAVAESGTNGTNIMVTAVVTSANAGAFNTLNLVDGNGNLLNFTVLTGNSGNNMSNLAIGSIVTFWVNIPQGSSQLQFQTQTATTTGGTSTPVGEPSTSTNSNTVTLAANSVSAGILNLLPNYFSLTTSYESQIITLTNTGNGDLETMVITPTAPLITLSNNCGATLAAGATCQYTVGFDKTQPIAGTSLVTVNYTSAGSASSATATVNYTGRIAIAGLTITSGTNPNFDFTSRTAESAQSMTSQITLTNTGSDAETLSSFSPPTYFSLNITGITGTACTTGLVLAKDASCNINLVYNTNGIVTPNATAPVTVNYSYTVLGASKTSSSSVGLTYQTVQSLASLTVSPATLSFATPVLNNAYDSSVQTIIISNNSDTAATNLDEILSGNDSALFGITKNNTCTATLAAGDSCSMDIQFGPFESSTAAGTKTASLDLSYNNAVITVNNNTPITAQAVSAQSAIITTAVTGNSGFTGAGTSGSPYSVNQNATPAPTVTITISNSGTVPATDFYITPSSLGNWTLVNNNCGTSGSGVTLNASGTCTFGLQLATATIGAQNYALSNIAMDWVDQDSPTGQTTQHMSGTIYAEVNAVTPPANLSESMSSYTFTNGTGTAESKFTATEGSTPAPTVTYTISNSSTGSANNFYVDWVQPQPNGWAITTNSCGEAASKVTLAGNSNCSIIFELDTTAAAEYDLDLSSLAMYWTNTGSATLQSQPLAGIIYAEIVTAPATKMIFISVTGTTGAMGGLAGANAICQGDANGGTKTGTLSATWKALLRGNNATTSGTTYATSMGETIATATGGDLIAVGATNGTLQHAIDKNQNGDTVSQLAWTGGKGTNTTTDNCNSWTNGTYAAPKFYKGSYGGSNSTTTWWNYTDQYTPAGYTQQCDQIQSLYCVQQ